jgi:hypothetical protein
MDYHMVHKFLLPKTVLHRRPAEDIYEEYLHVCIQAKYKPKAAKQWIFYAFSAFLLIP